MTPTSPATSRRRLRILIETLSAATLGGLTVAALPSRSPAPPVPYGPLPPVWVVPGDGNPSLLLPPEAVGAPGVDPRILFAAPAGIDPRFVVAAPSGIDEGMIVPAERRRPPMVAVPGPDGGLFLDPVPRPRSR